MLPQILVDLENNNRTVYTAFKYMRFVQVKVQNFFKELSSYARKLGYKDKKYLKLKDMKNKYKGKRCFVIATGPSLTIEDLELLKDEYTFGMNSICLAYDKTDWRPTFFGVQDKKVYEIIKEKLDEEVITFLPGSLIGKEYVGDNVVPFPCNSYYHDFELRYDICLFSRFSDDCYRIVYDGYSITHSLLQIAIYLGFDEIYLLGADCNYVAGEKHHFIEHGHSDPKYLTAGERNIVSYETVKEFAINHGIKIYNVTRGGMLDVFERKTLEEVLACHH